jgi:hypothetical protein
LLVDLIARFSPNAVFSKDQIISWFYNQFFPTYSLSSPPDK